MPTSDTLLPPQRLDHARYLDHGGYLGLRYAAAEPDRAQRALLTTPLTGLGGAHFPLSRKLESALATDGPRVVVCNAAEDEPGSGKDRALLARNPHVVLEGALIAALVLDARDVILYVSELADQEYASITAAYAEVAERYPFAAVRVVRADPRYVSGEATAAVDAINGGTGKPTGRPLPTERGVNGLPTLVANCETLANLPRIVRAAWAGQPPPRSRLATVSGDITNPGVYEIDPDTDTFGDLFARAGALTGSGRLKAIQPGGPSTRFLAADCADILIADAAIRTAGSQPGCLAIRVLATSSCMVEVCEEITGFFSREQCGQCPPCRMKTQTYHRTLQQVVRQKGSHDLLEKLGVIEEFVADMPHKCSLIDMPTPPVASARSLFPDDFTAHTEYGLCVSAQPLTSSQ
ncbi:MAG: NADH-ubiquinone oxidoreductase-F iron-sulfur binding region domain-containing protein [Mycobacterium sp.]